MIKALDTTGLRSPESNQCLAMLGDAVLEQVLLDDWYASGTPKGESTAGSKPIVNSDLASKVSATLRSRLLGAMQTWHWWPVESAWMPTSL